MNKLKKWFNPTPIWRNPIGWARKVGQSRTKVIVWIIIHIAFILLGLWSIYFLNGKIQNGDFLNQTVKKEFEIMTIIPGAGAIVFIGVLYPAFYLYVIYRLLQEIDKRDKVGGQSSSL